MNWLEKIILFISFLFIIVSVWLFMIHFQTHYQGVLQIKEKKYEAAKQVFAKALRKNIDSHSSRMNLALIYSLKNNLQEAINEYLIVVEKSLNVQERFQSYFNIAILKFLEKDLNGSLNFYQKALEEIPSSKEVKINIEQMMQQKNSQKQSEKNQEDTSKKNKNSENPKKKGNLDQQKNEQKEQKTSDKNQSEDTKDNDQKTKNSSEENSSQLDPEIGKDQKGRKKELSQKQIQFIFKELEDREKKLKFRLKQNQRQKRQTKQW